jgi:hypothetical protein
VSAITTEESDVNLQSPNQLEANAYFFNPRELARLAVYRAAIIARFYTDQCEPLSIQLGTDAVRLLESVRRDQQAAAA